MVSFSNDVRMREVFEERCPRPAGRYWHKHRADAMEAWREMRDKKVEQALNEITEKKIIDAFERECKKRIQFDASDYDESFRDDVYELYFSFSDLINTNRGLYRAHLESLMGFVSPRLIIQTEYDAAWNEVSEELMRRYDDIC